MTHKYKINKMVSITLSVPEEIHELMRRFPEINWSALVRSFIAEKAKKLATKKEILMQLGREKQFNEWAVNLIREGRKEQVK